MRSVATNLHSASSSIDWSGIKFLVAEEMGECMDAVYARRDTQAQQTEFYLCNHKYHDGVGGFTKILEGREGYSSTQMPQIKVKTRPSFFKKLILLKKFITLTSKLKTSWLNRIDKTGESDGVVFVFLDKQQTQNLKELATKSEASLNSYLFWAIDQVTHDFFLTFDSERKWVCPVNMRGAFGKENDYGNVAASIILNFREQQNPRLIHQQTKSYFENHLHVGSWLYTNMARFVGLWGTRKVAKKIKDVGVGVFSNMGQWPVADSKVSPDATAHVNWAVVPPASQVLPVCCAALEWQGRLSLGIQLHPCLEKNLDQAHEFTTQVLKKAFQRNIKDEIEVKKVESSQLKKTAQRIA